MAKDLSPDEKATIRATEDDDLRKLFAFADATVSSDVRTLSIRRDGVEALTFRIRPLREIDAEEARKAATRRVPNPDQRGPRTIEQQDDVILKSELIVRATVAEDRARIWDNPALWKHCGVITASECVDAVLRAGEKLQVYTAINKASGFREDESVEDAAAK